MCNTIVMINICMCDYMILSNAINPIEEEMCLMDGQLHDKYYI
jgi:hypothetical protein